MNAFFQIKALANYLKTLNFETFTKHFFDEI